MQLRHEADAAVRAIATQQPQSITWGDIESGTAAQADAGSAEVVRDSDAPLAARLSAAVSQQVRIALGLPASLACAALTLFPYRQLKSASSLLDGFTDNTGMCLPIAG